MNSAARPLSVVGAGIVGLMVAYEARMTWPSRPISVFDEGLDPRSRAQLPAWTGATWSGLDARHISLTETAPWTASHRLDLIEREVESGGWNCLSRSHISVREARWLSEFKAIASQPGVHRENCDRVFEINREGLRRWAALLHQRPDLFSPTTDAKRLAIVCGKADELHGEYESEAGLDPERVTQPLEGLPPELKQLESKVEDGSLYGSFFVAGSAYRVKRVCCALIDALEQTHTTFHWGARVDLDRSGSLGLPMGDVVWAAGTSTRSASLLARFDLLVQGVLGVWVAIPNPGVWCPFKVLALEPVNFINCTPVGDRLLLSGGYGWVGERTYAEALPLAKPLMRTFLKEVARLLTRGTTEDLALCETAMCLRPALPSGVPAIHELGRVSSQHRVIVGVGHAAGGFTESPAVARTVITLLA